MSLPVIIAIFTFHSLLSLAQVPTLTKILELQLSQPPLNVGIDRFDQLYLVFPTGELVKYRMNGDKIVASQHLPPSISWVISTDNPFKLSFFSPSFQELFVFDQQLALREKIHLQYRYPLDVVKLTFKNTFIGWCTATRELLEFSSSGNLLQNKHMHLDLPNQENVVDIDLFKENFLLLTNTGKLYRTTFEGETSLLPVVPAKFVYVQGDYLVSISTNTVVVYNESFTKIHETTLPPGDYLLSNGKVVITLKENVIEVYR